MVMGGPAGALGGNGRGADAEGDGLEQADTNADPAAPGGGSDMVQPEPTPENPNPAPVDRPDPSNGPLSAAAAKMAGAETPSSNRQNWNDLDQPAIYRDTNADRGYQGLDGLISLAEKLPDGIEDAARLRQAKNLFQKADKARTEGNNDLASMYARQGNQLYQAATESNDTLRSGAEKAAEAYPIPYTFNPGVEGGELAVSQTRQSGETIDGETITQPGKVGGFRPKGIAQGNDHMLENAGIIYGEEPADVRAAREQRAADDFSARYGQEGQTPYRGEAIEGELDRSGELPPAQQQAALPPGHWPDQYGPGPIRCRCAAECV